MKFEVKANLQYQVKNNSSIILNISALNTPHQKVISETLEVTKGVHQKEFLSSPEGNRLTSLEILNDQNLNINYSAQVNQYCEIKGYDRIKDLNIAKLPANVLTYLNPSRYCQSDKLYRLANNMFGYKKDDFDKVSALTHWIYLNVAYLSGSTDAETSAYDTVTEQAGVCRDFAHLGIALCRALTIPARYFTGYAYQLSPPDFHACFEAYIDGDWVLFDATRLIPLNGMVKIATGRDAADAAVASLFGDINFISSKISCELIDQKFEPFNQDDQSRRGVIYL
ncbi:MAG: transglutaminase family protein [Bacteroidetes bacterium]|nr:transglutaminase family protein [Bacteroidota bacterium]MBU1373817.1 transglutaminase family protein [Bacteroidota bacterium]MBU1483923.1 transglutaminase family protein [Bacteroidota bacterium]MBU2268566.1 transglutaminase family protein [Bacteroidota bacterium]MBU2374528.1 transglutaminase family protein [Bacteroidota bacterium]